MARWWRSRPSPRSLSIQSRVNTVRKPSVNNPPKYNDAGDTGKSDRSQTLIKSLPLSAIKGSEVPGTKIHPAFSRAPTVYQSLLWASSNYKQIEVREA